MKTLKEVMSENDGCKCGCKGSKGGGCTCGPDCKDCDCEDKGLKGESFTFDKFMDSILVKEVRHPQNPDSPNRERARRHQERPLNRIKFGGNS
jgi:hypothetical protein